MVIKQEDRIAVETIRVVVSTGRCIWCACIVGFRLDDFLEFTRVLLRDGGTPGGER